MDSIDRALGVTRDKQALYAERFNRYVMAMRNCRPDRIPARPFVSEFTAKCAGYTCQEVTHDYSRAFDAAIKCTSDSNWDAGVPRRVDVRTGITQAQGSRYYAIPDIDVGQGVGFQYREPDESKSFMLREEYDELIDDSTRFLCEVWLPRISTEIAGRVAPNSCPN
jgi:hypothetical protein